MCSYKWAQSFAENLRINSGKDSACPKQKAQEGIKVAYTNNFMLVVEPIYTKRIDINQRLKDYNLKQKEDGLGLGTNQRKKRGRSI